MRIAVLVSGNGSNLQALIDGCITRKIPATIAVVISNNPDAYALERAKQAGIPAEVHNHRGIPREQYDETLHSLLREYDVEFVCLAGFMRLLTATFVQKWHNRLINIHPSLLPAFKGIKVHEQVLAAAVKFTGCTVHFVRPEMDEGPIIVQAAVPVRPDDTPETLAARVQHAEHACYELALQRIAEGRVQIVEERVVIKGAEVPHTSVMNPLAF
jgi:phosphoribosylglycinamide formyltransferase-1